MSDEWCRRLLRMADHLPERDLTTLVAALADGTTGLERFRMRAAAPAVRRACQTVLDAITATSVPFAQGVLLGAVNVRRTATPVLDVVWTGPASTVTTSRLTSAAVVDLIDAARSEIWLISFAMHDEPRLAGALERAGTREVAITLVAEHPADNPSFHGPAQPFPGLRARRLRWPAAQRPSGASLHAKTLVVDRSLALVGSANVTSSALERNLECGVLIRDVHVAGDIVDHLQGLAHAGVLVRNLR